MSNHQAKKLEKKIQSLENELAALKGSRAYRLARTAGILKTKLKHDPVGLTKKLAKTVATDPRRLVRLAKGTEQNTGIATLIANRAANYHRWMTLEEPTEEDLAAQRKASTAFKKKPVISILTPVFDPPVDVLRELVESVINQTYPHMELLLGNFGKSDAVKQLLDEYAERDTRIKVYGFAENLGISGNSNLLLEKAQGDYTGLLDHDDTLSLDALYENVKLLNEADYDFIYSDKDMCDEAGNRYEPLFKPDPSPELMLNANYYTHFDVMRTSLMRKVGGWDPATDGAQDWDLFLKLMNAGSKMAHIPKVLYHWRVIATSTAHSIETKPYALAGQRKAVQKYLDAQGIDATPFHHRTELLLEWKEAAVDQDPLVLVHMHSLSDAVRTLGSLRVILPKKAAMVVMHAGVLADSDERMLRRQGAKQFLAYEANSFAELLSSLARRIPTYEQHNSLLFVDDRIRISKQFNYRDFAGWLSIFNVAAVGGRVVDSDNNTLDVGSILSENGVLPLFHNCAPYFQSYQGNVEWTRNLRVVARDFFVCDRKALQEAHIDTAWSDEAALLGSMIAMSQKRRLVSYPKAIVQSNTDPFAGFDQSSLLPLIRKVLAAEPTKGADRYGNPNLHPSDTLSLVTDQLGKTAEPAESSDSALDSYQHDALILSRAFDLTEEEINRNMAENTRPRALGNPKTVGWFLPAFDAIYAGLNNIFSFAEFLAGQGLTVHFYILKGGHDASDEKQLVAKKYKGLANASFTVVTADDVTKVPKLDIGICTQWASAYVLAKCRGVTRKCYFIQDNEPNFYPNGSISSLAELTYRLGFYAIANTDGLLELYHSKYGGRGVALKSLVNLEAYHSREDRYFSPKKPYRVFFYARPNMPRNAFELGLAGLHKLKEQLGDEVQIIAAGADWDPADYGAAHVIENMGKIPYDKVPEFYRTIDAGLMFMFSGHPGVVASELMASGCPAVVNQYEDSTWHELYKHEETCLVTAPTASEIARNIRRCLEDASLRRTLIDGGLQKTHDFYSGYDRYCKKAFEAIKKG